MLLPLLGKQCENFCVIPNTYPTIAAHQPAAAHSRTPAQHTRGSGELPLARASHTNAEQRTTSLAHEHCPQHSTHSRAQQANMHTAPQPQTATQGHHLSREDRAHAQPVMLEHSLFAHSRAPPHPPDRPTAGAYTYARDLFCSGEMSSATPTFPICSKHATFRRIPSPPVNSVRTFAKTRSEPSRRFPPPLLTFPSISRLSRNEVPAIRMPIWAQIQIVSKPSQQSPRFSTRPTLLQIVSTILQRETTIPNAFSQRTP